MFWAKLPATAKIKTVAIKNFRILAFQSVHFPDEVTMNLSYESWVTRFVERLADHFNLQNWSIYIEFLNEEEKGGAYAENCINSRYMYSTLKFYKQSRLDYAAGKMEHLVSAVVHELVHIFLDPFQDWMHPHLSISTTPMFMDVLENQTQKLTVAFLKSLPENIIPPFPKKAKK